MLRQKHAMQCGPLHLLFEYRWRDQLRLKCAGYILHGVSYLLRPMDISDSYQPILVRRSQLPMHKVGPRAQSLFSIGAFPVRGSLKFAPNFSTDREPDMVQDPFKYETPHLSQNKQHSRKRKKSERSTLPYRPCNAFFCARRSLQHFIRKYTRSNAKVSEIMSQVSPSELQAT